MASVGKYAALNVVRESIKGMQEKCAQGWYPAKAPFGYLNVSDASENKKHKILIPDPKASHKDINARPKERERSEDASPI